MKRLALKKNTEHLPDNQKWNAQRYGDIDPEALEAVLALHNAVNLKTASGDHPGEEADPEYRHRAWALIAKHYSQDWHKPDGSFFRAMANAMEVLWGSSNSCAVVRSEIYLRETSGLPLPTVNEMHSILARAGIKVDPKTVRRDFKYWGRIPSPDKPIQRKRK